MKYEINKKWAPLPFLWWHLKIMPFYFFLIGDRHGRNALYIAFSTAMWRLTYSFGPLAFSDIWKKIQGARYLHKKTWTEQKCILKYTYWVNDALFWKRHWYAGSDRKRSFALLLVLQQSATGSHYFIHFLCLHFHTSIRPNSTVHLGPFPHYSFQNWCVEKGLTESQTLEIALKTVEIALM